MSDIILQKFKVSASQKRKKIIEKLFSRVVESKRHSWVLRKPVVTISSGSHSTGGRDSQRQADNIITIYWGQTTESQQLIVSRLRADRVRDNIQVVTRLSRMMLSKFKRIPLSSSYQCSR